jgi:hypothetical protein
MTTTRMTTPRTVTMMTTMTTMRWGRLMPTRRTRIYAGFTC